VGERVWWAVPAHVVAADESLVEAFDAAIGEGEPRAGRHIPCRLGCTGCCIGPFDITTLAAARLAHGMEFLTGGKPEAVHALRGRAQEQWRAMAADFWGDAGSGILDSDEGRRDEFFARFGDVPCPVLDPTTGACLLDAWRPLSCRSSGLPVRCGTQILPPCPLNFTTAEKEEVTFAIAEPDLDDHEGELLADGVRSGTVAAETIICAVLIGSEGPRPS
jgi:hypothetical protein